MSKVKKEGRVERTKEELLQEARQIEQKDLDMRREGFVTEYNKLVTKYGFNIVAAPKLVPAGAGLFAVGSDLVVQPVPPKENGNSRG